MPIQHDFTKPSIPAFNSDTNVKRRSFAATVLKYNRRLVPLRKGVGIFEYFLLRQSLISNVSEIVNANFQ
jgi:hypothetical protein